MQRGTNTKNIKGQKNANQRFHRYRITHEKFTSKCNQTIKNNGTALKAMACTDIDDENSNSTFVLLRIHPLALNVMYVYVITVLVQLLLVRISAGTNLTIQHTICVRDETF